MKKQNAFTEKVNKIALSANHNKRIQSIGSVETYGYRASKDLIYKYEETKYSNIKKEYQNN